MTTVLITGANRGIGLEHVRQYADKGARVHACCRDPENANELKALADASGGNVLVHKFDQSKPEDAARLAGEIDEPIDILWNNAGTAGDRSNQVFGTAADTMNAVFDVNVTGPLRLSEALIGHVEKSDRKVIAMQSSQMGSIKDNGSGGVYAYRASKAALNMVTRSMARDLQEKGVTVVAFHPGWVQTDMGGPNAKISTEESVQGEQEVVDNLTIDRSGEFIRYSGEKLPW